MANTASTVGIRVLSWGLGGLLAAVGLLVLVSCLLYPPTYVYRVLVWNFADVGDYRRFPPGELPAGEPNFTFRHDLDEDRVRRIFNSNPRVKDLDAFLAAQDTQAFIVIQDDRILYEKYFNGTTRDSIVTSFSMAKSFTSALIGIAIAEGHIGSVDDPITQYLPELAERDPRFSNITIRHLLLMSSGIRYKEFPFLNGDDGKTYYYPDLRKLALTGTKIDGPPGEVFLYNNYHPLLLGLILERATGVPVQEYLHAKIWQPLGMEYAGSWSLDSAATRFPKMESGINARAIDFARFGRLFLNNGAWEGRQIVPEAWVTESARTEPDVDRSVYYRNDLEEFDRPTAQTFYAYMWWGFRRGAHRDFAARGNLGQVIYVSPQSKLLIVKNAASYGDLSFIEWQDFFTLAAAGFAGS